MEKSDKERVKSKNPSFHEDENPHKLGKTGEEVALRYLLEKKYKIVTRNFRFYRGEIDIVAYDGPTLVFVEVKTRRSEDFGFPEESVDFAKQKQIRKIAAGYLAKTKLRDVECRFDVISLSFHENGDWDVKHIKNAF